MNMVHCYYSKTIKLEDMNLGYSAILNPVVYRPPEICCVYIEYTSCEKCKLRLGFSIIAITVQAGQARNLSIFPPLSLAYVIIWITPSSVIGLFLNYIFEHTL